MDLLSLDLEEFLASTQVAPPPPITVDPSLNLTTEQISAFIIPPPPAKVNCFSQLLPCLNEYNPCITPHQKVNEKIIDRMIDRFSTNDQSSVIKFLQKNH